MQDLIEKERASEPNSKDLGEIFDDIYCRDSWNGGSGPGSTVEFTKGYCEFIKKFVANNGINTILDIGCGDWQFSQHLIPSLNVEYFGVDVSPIALHITSKRFADFRTHFLCDDASTNLWSLMYYIYGLDSVRLTKHTTLLLCKDVMQHWSSDRWQPFLRDVIAWLWSHPTSTYALVTNDSGQRDKDIKDGEYGPLDLSKFGDTIYIFPDQIKHTVQIRPHAPANELFGFTK